jgi:hypothetical protein
MLALGYARGGASLAGLLGASDVVTLHVPELPSTQWMIGAQEIAAMKPGVLSAINQVFAENGINIAGQYLRTDEKVGYVVIDLAAQSSGLAVEKLTQVPGTIRCRVLF